jgi:hypothetical protein
MPFLVVILDGVPVGRIDERRLFQYIHRITGVAESSDAAEWEVFADEQQLTIDGHPILASPTRWWRSASLWFAVAVDEAKSEAHLYFGWVAREVSSARYTHIDLINASRRWLPGLPSAVTPWFRWPMGSVGCSGYASNAGSETGIVLRGRSSFVSTIIDKESGTLFLSLLSAIVLAVIKVEDYSMKTLATAAAALLGIFILFVVVRHLWVLPRLTWGLEGLKD